MKKITEKDGFIKEIDDDGGVHLRRGDAMEGIDVLIADVVSYLYSKTRDGNLSLSVFISAAMSVARDANLNGVLIEACRKVAEHLENMQKH